VIENIKNVATRCRTAKSRETR